MSDTAFTKGKATHGGKGSAPRPIPNHDKYASNWDAIFGKKEETKDASSDKSTTER